MSTFGDFGTFGGDGDPGTSESPVVRLLKSFEQLATIYTWSAGAVDDYNQPTDVYTSAGVWPCRLWQTTGRENQQDRDTQIGTYQLAVPPDAVIDGHSRVEVDAVMFEVTGPPLHRRTPSGPHHITATLQVTS